MRFLSLLLLLSSMLVLRPAFGQTSLSPRADSSATLPAPPVATPAGEVDDFGEEEEAAAGTAAGGKTNIASTKNGCCEKKPFRLSPRHTWDVNVDGTFLLPRFVTNNWYGYGNYYTGAYFNNMGLWSSPYGVQSGGSSTLLVRRNVSTRKKGKSMQVRRGAYRYGLTVSLDMAGAKADTLWLDRPMLQAYGYYTQQANSYFGARFGYERQEQFGRFQFTYGYEVGLLHRWQNSRLLTTYPREGFRTEETNFWARALGATAAGVAGVRFYLHPRVSVALESRFELNYTRQRSGGLAPLVYQNNGIRYGDRPFRSWFFSQRFVPLSGIYLAFHLGKPVRVK